MRQIRKMFVLLTFTVAPFIFILPKAHAVVMVDATVTPIGGALFHYDVSVSNTGPDDVALVSIIDAPLGDADILATLLSPAGFLANYDPGVGIIDFLEFTDLFAVGTTIETFSFDTAAAPAMGFITSFEALTINGDLLSGDIQIETIAVVSEPSIVALLALGLTFFARKRKHVFTTHQGESR